MISSDIICILGPTATGKTKLAVQLANTINAEIISVDSRQVYRDMDIGSGKDLEEYDLNGKQIPHHLINIREAGEKYNLYEFKKDCNRIINEIQSRGKAVILCGGTGLYFDSILFDYDLPEASIDPEFRKELEKKSDEELISMLSDMTVLHNTTDTTDRNRLLRAIEVARASENGSPVEITKINAMVFGLRGDRELIKKRIEIRLKERLESGLIEEVKGLLDKGITLEDLKYYGLEYKFVCQFLLEELNYNDMFQKLRSGINQFSKRQMTWFRRMEKKGLEIKWLEIESGIEKNLDEMLNNLKLPSEK